MRTAGSLYSVSSTACSRKPTVKRRKLNTTWSTSHIEAATITGKALPASPNTPDAGDGGSMTFTIGSKLSCSSCHRALSSAVRSGAGLVVICAKCMAPTCTVCSRTCSSIQPPFPLTPPPTQSPSPSPIQGNNQSNPGSTSPKRIALGSNAFVMHCDATMPPSVKRKRSLVEKVDADTRVKTCDQQSSSLSCDIVDDISSVPLPGCGRIICKACCIESVVSGDTLCVDCDALV
ncbi:hypothetical protein SCLCIDRAFT_117859 [Scleroderma citrinum Foug A]|uniref:Uncharacterized protein n=1 Tax=Scleroderma citrinum Foug A TaxID=1036808 RepID=A0A0C3AE89_9AGAM|nr:hypothetical protein SCLCIDRAFT_117859 [Scleroderma citrinum Foug A]